MGDVTPLPFHPDDPSFSRPNALYLAHAADIAYHRAPARAAAERLGLRAVAFRHKITRTRGFLGLCDTHAILSFRGSDPVTLPNWLTDSLARLVSRPHHYPGRVHHGFSSALKHSWPQLLPLITQLDNRPLFLTGHSMGGALAVLTACRLANLGIPHAATYTFGSPRLGDPTFCSSYAHPTYRLVNRLDLVPELPLASVKRMLPQKPRLTNEKILARLHRLADRVPAYAHVNTLVYLDRDGTVTENPDIEPWPAHAVERALATRGKSFLEGITDHLITNYIRGLEGQVGKKQTGVRRRIRVD